MNTFIILFIALTCGLFPTTIAFSSEHHFNRTIIAANDSLEIKYDVNRYRICDFDIKLISYNGNMNVSIIGAQINSCAFFILDEKCGNVNVLNYHRSFWPGGLFSIVITNLRNNSNIEISGYIKVEQEDIVPVGLVIGATLGAIAGFICVLGLLAFGYHKLRKYLAGRKRSYSMLN
jgi:hypothetical protein